jgi:hypothetical protein
MIKNKKRGFMTGLEFYLKKNLGLTEKDPALKEILSYLTYEGYEVIFDKTAKEHNIIHAKKHDSVCIIENNLPGEEIKITIDSFNEETGDSKKIIIKTDNNLSSLNVQSDVNDSVHAIFKDNDAAADIGNVIFNFNVEALLHLKEELLSEGIYLKILIHELDKQIKESCKLYQEKINYKRI